MLPTIWHLAFELCSLPYLKTPGSLDSQSLIIRKTFCRHINTATFQQTLAYSNPCQITSNSSKVTYDIECPDWRMAAHIAARFCSFLEQHIWVLGF